MDAPPAPASSRRGFLAGAGAVALASAAAGCGGNADEFTGRESEGGGDLQILNYALTLEYVESDFYEQAVGSGVLSGRELEIFKLIEEDEQQHVTALRAAIKQLKGSPVAKPTTDFDAEMQGGPETLVRTASDLENLGAAAYLGAASSIISATVLKAALSIHTVEGRHAAVLNHLSGRPFLPDGPLATPLDQDDVLPRIKKFII